MNPSELYVKLKAAVIDGLEFIKTNEEVFFNFNLSSYYDDYPEFRYAETGYPNFSIAPFKRKNYYALLMKDDFCMSLTTWKTFGELLSSNDNYCKHYFIGKYSDIKEEAPRKFWDKFFFSYPIFAITERYIHLNSTKEFNEVKFKELYNEWLNNFSFSELKFDIYVPILMASFDFDELQINSQIKIERMSDLFQKSRNIQTSANSSQHTQVISAATHAFVLKDYSIPNRDDKSANDLNKIGCYTNVISSCIDKLFVYVRCVSGIDIGYSQIISYPHNWANSWNTDLIPLKIASKRAYPDYFEDYYWTRIPKIISANIFKIDDIEKYLSPLQRNVEIAIERLNSAFLRRHIDDSVLDVTIGLESLYIESGENTEVTHKLATRVASLCKKYPLDSFTPFQVFKACKSIYAFRSAIIHSKDTKKVDKSRNLKIEEHSEIRSIEAGIRILSHSLNVLIKTPLLLNTEELDKGLFENIITS